LVILYDTSLGQLQSNIELFSLYSDLLAISYKVHITMEGNYTGRPNETLLDSGGMLQKPISIGVNDGIYFFDAGNPLNPIVTTMSNLDGNSAHYPFDTWTDTLQIWAQANITGNTTYIPLNVLIFGTIPSLTIDPVFFSPDATRPYRELVPVTISRSATTKGFSLLICSIMWVLALATTRAMYKMIWSKHEIPPGMIAAIASLLFAIVNVRGAQPGVPPIGILIDVSRKAFHSSAMPSITRPFAIPSPSPSPSLSLK
ncbi:hypothetical protein BC936DRAFT_149658, partial [Jimgerdemannia flammicorona]